LKNSQELVKVEKHLGVGRYSLLFDKQFTKQNIKAPAFATEGITTKNLPSIDKTFFGHYNSQQFVRHKEPRLVENLVQYSLHQCAHIWAQLHYQHRKL
ncbi:hypothetical protein, partial [Mycoplasmopsis bovis]|uniref:hypothetical protein n=1 Tax=Mycoplasmopsis bovis TaxID=28903 RepID=UPI003D282E57